MVKGDRDVTISFMRYEGWKIGRTLIHHTDVEIFLDVSVEVHHIPNYTFDPFRYRTYREWFHEQAKCAVSTI